jgi:hypothetical protein
MTTITFAVTTLTVVKAGIPPCQGCDAEVAGWEIGEGIYLCEVHHDLGCPRVLTAYEKG